MSPHLRDGLGHLPLQMSICRHRPGSGERPGNSKRSENLLDLGKSVKRYTRKKPYAMAISNHNDMVETGGGIWGRGYEVSGSQRPPDTSDAKVPGIQQYEQECFRKIDMN